MSLSVDVIVAAHDQLSAPFAGMEESAQRFACTMDAVRERTRTWSVDELVTGANAVERETPGATQALRLLGSTASTAGLQFMNVGPMARATALMIRTSGETAKAGWLGILGPIALVAAALGGVLTIFKNVQKGWAEQAEAAKKALEAEHKAVKDHADFMIEQDIRIAKARGDQERVWQLQMQQGGKAARQAIEERRQAAQADLTSLDIRVVTGPGQSKRISDLRAEEELAKLRLADEIEIARVQRDERNRAKTDREKAATDLINLWAGQRQEDAEHLRAIEAAIAAQEKAQREHDEHEKDAAELRRREWAESLRRPEEEYRALEEAIKAGQEALRVSLAGGGGQSPEWILSAIAGWKQAQGDIAEAFKNAGMDFGADKPARYRDLEAFESMTALRAPGVDPMERQVELSKRMLDTMEKVEKNTKPGTPGWKPAPVY